MNHTTSPFLTAEWRHLAMLNFEIDPKVLQPLVPAGTELDDWQGRTFVSMVGFLFLNTRVFGMAIPWHRDFEEVNLRFYVRRKASDGWRRGVVFVKELVPRIAIALAGADSLPRELRCRADATPHRTAGQARGLWRTPGGSAAARTTCS